VPEQLLTHEIENGGGGVTYHATTFSTSKLPTNLQTLGEDEKRREYSPMRWGWPEPTGFTDRLVRRLDFIAFVCIGEGIVRVE
jgi:hypothetical protein